MKKLYLCLIPSSSWFSNARSVLSKEEWNSVRRKVYESNNFECYFCGKKKLDKPEAHELFEYDTEKSLQILTKVICVCKKCHHCCHWGLWQLKGEEDELYRHIMKVNGWSKPEAQKHVAESFKVWQDRSNIDWDLDLTILYEKYGLSRD